MIAYAVLEAFSVETFARRAFEHLHGAQAAVDEDCQYAVSTSNFGGRTRFRVVARG